MQTSNLFASIWDNYEGPFQLQSTLGDQPKPLLRLHHSSSFVSSPSYFPYSLRGAIPRAPLINFSHCIGLHKLSLSPSPLPPCTYSNFSIPPSSPTHYFSNMPVIFSPQSLCIGYSICLECSFPTSPRGYPLIPLSPFQSYLLVNTVSALHPKTTRNLPAVERVGFIACCNEGEHPPWGTVRFSV